MRKNIGRNYGFGRQLRYAFCQAFQRYYGVRDHFGTRRAHFYRVRILSRYCNRQGIYDATLISQSTLDNYGAYLRQRIKGDYLWPDGMVDKQISIAYAHNLISTANVALHAIRGDTRIELSAQSVLGVSRRHVRETPAKAEVDQVNQAAADMAEQPPLSGLMSRPLLHSLKHSGAFGDLYASLFR